MKYNRTSQTISERSAIHGLGYDFAMAIIGCLHAHLDKGKTGWDDPAQVSDDSLKAALVKNLDAGDYVDVGAIAAILHNRHA